MPDTVRPIKVLHLAAGPLLFCALAFLPIVGPPYTVRCGLGLLL